MVVIYWERFVVVYESLEGMGKGFWGCWMIRINMSFVGGIC